MLGVVHCRVVAYYIAWPLYWMTKFVSPVIWLSKMLKLDMDAESTGMSLEEIRGIAELGTEEGALDHLEGSVIANVIGLDELLVKDVLTPRVVVFRIEENTLVKDLAEEIVGWNFSRVPLFSESEPEFLNSYVTQIDIYRALLQGKGDLTVKEFARELKSIPELMRADKLLLRMFEEKDQICAIADEHGSLAGIITLEDIIEEIVGREIVDEYDTVSDMRTLAKILHYTKHRKKQK